MLGTSIARQRMSMLVFVVFAVVALTLASVGLYGVVAHGVTERTHEIGVRIALGAEQRHVLGLVVRQGLSMALVGTAIGVAGSRRAVAMDSGVAVRRHGDRSGHASRRSSRRCWPSRWSRATCRPGARRASIRRRRCGRSESTNAGLACRAVREPETDRTTSRSRSVRARPVDGVWRPSCSPRVRVARRARSRYAVVILVRDGHRAARAEPDSTAHRYAARARAADAGAEPRAGRRRSARTRRWWSAARC